MTEPVLVHATAILIGTTGLVLVGPSGSGKSAMALALLATAGRLRHFCGLIGDDQIFIEKVGDAIIAHGPPNISGLIEIRGSGIGHCRPIGKAALTLAISPIRVDASNRIPAENLRATLSQGIDLPLLPIDRSHPDPFAVLEAMLPGFPLLQGQPMIDNP